jgi:hypothetical protein
MELASCHTPGAYNFEVDPRFLEYLWTPDLTHGAEVAIKHCDKNMCKSLFPNMKNKQDRQCTYNVTLRRAHETIVTLEKH